MQVGWFEGNSTGHSKYIGVACCGVLPQSCSLTLGVALGTLLVAAECMQMTSLSKNPAADFVKRNDCLNVNAEESKMLVKLADSLSFPVLPINSRISLEPTYGE